MAVKSRAHLHASGALMGELDADSEQSAIEAVQEREANGRSKRGNSPKIHLRA